MPRPIRATISAGALAHNLLVAKAYAKGARLWAVVKANAYGHGVERAARALDATDGFAVLDFQEAVRLRVAGVGKPILMLEGFFKPVDLPLLVEHDLTPVIHNAEQVEMLRLVPLPGEIDVYLKVNSGMNRLGFGAESLRPAYNALRMHPQVRNVTLMTHFADADGAGGVQGQLDWFNALAKGFEAPRSLANSAALIRFPEARGDSVRPGIMLYGCSPFAGRTAESLNLKPAMTLSSEIIATQRLHAGERIGYGFSYEAAGEMAIGVVACGYADGYPRHAPSGTPVLVNGRRTRTVGRVSMDMICIDISGIPGADIEARDLARLPTGIGELDRALGAGLVPGQVVLLGGDPGIGKSTLLLQTLATLKEVLYVTGEESAEQIAMRARRLSLDAGGVRLLAETQLERILGALDAGKPAVAVIDSIQTLWSEMLQSAPGSVAQVRECAAQLTRHAKRAGTALFIIGHVTKEGAIAGPRVLEHIVDTVLYFEGDPHSSFRLIRAVKNRFGAVNELGVFAMTDKGLRGVTNPSALFLSQHPHAVPGSCVVATLEGTRPLLVEIQALVDAAHAPNPRRLSVGLEQNRLAMLLAVLHRHAGIATWEQDVFVNAVGGVRIGEPAADLAVSLAVVSSLSDRAIPEKVVVFGEIGLAGEVRPAPRGQDRLKEAAKLGFEKAIVPRANQPKAKIQGLEVMAVERVDQAVQLLRDL